MLFKGSPLWLLQRNLITVQAYLCRLLCILHIQLIFNGCIKYLVSLINVGSAAGFIQEWSRDHTKSWKLKLLSISNLTKGFSQYTLYQSETLTMKKKEYWQGCPPWNIFIYLKFVLLTWVLVTQLSYTPDCFSRDPMPKSLLMNKLAQRCDVRKQAQQVHLNQNVACFKLFSP